MTKRRAPLTYARALTRVAELLGWDGCAQVIERADGRPVTENWVRKLSDPDAEREISLRNAFRLDAAYQRAGGEDAPFRDCYSLRLELESDSGRASTSDLMSAASIAVKETGEAMSAALAAIENGGSEPHRQLALKELEEGIASLIAMTVKLGGAKLEGAR